MKRLISRGVIHKIERCDSGLSFVTIDCIDEKCESRIPVYTAIGDEYMGRFVEIVDVVYRRGGSFVRRIEQEISTSSKSIRAIKECR